MSAGKYLGCETRTAVRFQQLLGGIIVLIAYAFQYTPLVIFLALTVLIACLGGFKCDLFMQLYMRFICSKRQNSETPATCTDPGKHRFVCAIEAIFLAVALFFLYLGKSGIFWIIVVVLSVILLLAGLVGFCLGEAVYLLLFKKKNRDVQ